jgi:hypothetical protein
VHDAIINTDFLPLIPTIKKMQKAGLCCYYFITSHRKVIKLQHQLMASHAHRRLSVVAASICSIGAGSSRSRGRLPLMLALPNRLPKIIVRRGTLVR